MMTESDCRENADVEDVLREAHGNPSRHGHEHGHVASPPGTHSPELPGKPRNLLHYLALRRRDLRPLSSRLTALGLSSLGRAESHVMATVDAVLGVLHGLAHRSWQSASEESPVVDFAKGQRLLTEHTNALLGAAPAGRSVRIMVTMPSEAADDYLLVRNLLQQGMDCIAIVAHATLRHRRG